MSTRSELRWDAEQQARWEALSELHEMGTCSGTPDCPICEEKCEHEKHVGQTCTYGCGLCEDDHFEGHVGENGSYSPKYVDCQFCENAWYEGQQRDH